MGPSLSLSWNCKSQSALTTLHKCGPGYSCLKITRPASMFDRWGQFLLPKVHSTLFIRRMKVEAMHIMYFLQYDAPVSKMALYQRIEVQQN